jgi:hypothetical protein
VFTVMTDGNYLWTIQREGNDVVEPVRFDAWEVLDYVEEAIAGRPLLWRRIVGDGDLYGFESVEVP